MGRHCDPDHLFPVFLSSHAEERPVRHDGPHSVTAAIAVEVLIVLVIFMSAAILTNLHGIIP
jgi:hypothetical protein